MKNFSPKNKFLWDPWLIKHKGNYHAFYLQTKKTKDFHKRHDKNVSIGHAISTDLLNWKELPTAFKPGKKGDWDDLALWTCSIIKKGKKFYMFYTARDKKTRTQKIGLATSENLKTWKKHKDNPLLGADEKFYETHNKKNKLGKAGTWRDPFVFKDPKSKKYHLTISARSKDKPKEYDGCIALAESKNLINWKTLPPILYPKKYDEMETSQIVFHNKKYYLFFSVPYKKSYSPKWARKAGSHIGLHCYVSNSLKGKYKPINKGGVILDCKKKIYGFRLIKDKSKYYAIGFLREKDGKFLGKLSFPIEINFD
ncbi:MAG: glycoside hydrolase family 68 protein [Nanoarchaeota archaeon]|nr:glycoside hydrolase family 68 protein [Nanoarchaeota archaeon]MBU1051994.1 glycoside hydrolase family 68 protein [Nanoarchaeota archaeon]MBU1988248.1 glycoside hydrolase family 68 protein [Nanoarchaeota archaeon]